MDDYRQCFSYFRYCLVSRSITVGVSALQGISVLWKGIGSSLVVRGCTLAVEDLTSKVTPWPKEIDRRCSLRMIGQHLLLKGVSLALVTPFYSASLVETVQSEIACDRPGMFDVFKEGLARVVSFTGPQSGRLLPIWVLVPTTVLHGMAHYILYTIAKGTSLFVIKRVITALAPIDQEVEQNRRMKRGRKASPLSSQRLVPESGILTFSVTDSNRRIRAQSPKRPPICPVSSSTRSNFPQ